MTQTDAPKPAKQKRLMKSAARLYAVQALFQMEQSGQTTEAVVTEFSGSPVWRCL